MRPGTKLHAVYVDRVILDRNGQLEALALPKQSTAAIAINRPPAPAANDRFTDNLRRIAENNPSAFAEIVRPQPVFANGVQRGYRVYPGRNRQQFAKLGLQPGDLVLSINGTPLDDPQRGMEIFNTMGTSDRVTVTIERNGQSQELTLNTAQITLPDANSPPPQRASESAVSRIGIQPHAAGGITTTTDVLSETTPRTVHHAFQEQQRSTDFGGSDLSAARAAKRSASH